MSPHSTNDSFYQPNFQPCECCKIKYTTSTSTTYKWTEEEIKDEILELATMLSSKKWYESKNYLKSELKHWCGKLSRLNAVKSDIVLSSISPKSSEKAEEINIKE